MKSFTRARSRSRILQVALLVLCLPILLVLTGCGSTQTASGGQPQPGPSVSIAAAPLSIAAGASSILTVSAASASQVTLTGSDGSSYTMSAAGGSKTVTPTATTTYTATATGSSGTSPATATATVTVAPAAAATVTLTASPASVSAGSSSVLTVTAANATQVTLTGSDGSSYTLPPAGGTQTVTPATTATYTATATGVAGTSPATATAKVTVIPAAAAATVTLTASPASVPAGSSSVLTVTAANATQVTLTGSDGSSYTLPPAGGTQTVTPATTTTYTATATGAAGTSPATAKATVTVTPASSLTVSLTASPATIVAGGSSVLTATATNATAVTVTGSDGSSYALQPAGGTVNVTPASSTTYTATATGAAGTTPVTSVAMVTVNAASAPTVTLSSSSTSVVAGNSVVLTVTASHASAVTITGSDNTSYTLPSNGGTQTVSPAATTTYTATATGPAGTTPASATVTVTVAPAGSLNSVQHVVLFLQENHSFDNYFGMLNPYRAANHFDVGADGNTYAVDGIDDKLGAISNQDDQGDTPFSLFKLISTCVDDMTSSWLESYGDVSRYDFTPSRPINMDGFVHTAQGFANFCAGTPGKCSGTFTDMTGQRAMGYYDEGFLNYYYYMASQFALSDRWFSPVSSKSISNRLATYTGGTTQGLVFDPGNDDQLPQLGIPTIFSELTAHNVSWKVYYSVSNGGCLVGTDCSALSPAKSPYPATDFSSFSEANQYLYVKTQTTPTCTGHTQDSTTVGDSSNSFCIDTRYVAPVSQYFTDVANNTLPNFAFIEAGYGNDDEHPGSTNSVLKGQAEAAHLINSLMSSPSWSSSVFFLSYDEAGGPYDHVPPVPGSSNKNTDAMVGSTPVSSIPDISTIAVSADGGTQYKPCVAPGGVPTIHCDLHANSDPGSHPGDAAAITGFPAQLGFRLPNMIISPFTRKHYVGHTPMDHTAVLKFVEDRFIGTSTHLTPRVAAQPDLLDFFDFSGAPWATPPTPPTPTADTNPTSCTPQNFHP